METPVPILSRSPSSAVLKKSKTVIFTQHSLSGNADDTPKLHLKGLERSLSTLDNSRGGLKKPFHSEYLLPKAPVIGEDNEAKQTRSYSAFPANKIQSSALNSESNTGNVTPVLSLSRKASKAQQSFRGMPGELRRGSSARKLSLSRRPSIRSMGSEEITRNIFEADIDLEGKDNPLWRDSFLPKVLQLKGNKSNTEPYGVDYIGGGTFQVSQFNLLAKRSVEPIKSNEGHLSARGLHHRSREQFEKEIKSSSHVISNSIRGRMGPTVTPGADASFAADFQLLPVYFQRALAYERLNEVDKAIADYNTAIGIDKRCAPAYFNRAGLLNTKGDLDGAIRDINKAVEIDPANIIYRRNRVILLRLKGDYSEAIHEAMVCRAVQLQPSLVKELKIGNEFSMDSEQLLVNFKGPAPKNPVAEVLAMPFDKRTSENIVPVVEFLAEVKHLQNFSSDRLFLRNIAMNSELKTYRKGDYIYRELDRSRSFYVILEGEVKLVVIDTRALGRPDRDPFDDPLRCVATITKGGSFGETALEVGGGLRTTGAMCETPTTLVSIEANLFHGIYSKYKQTLKEEVRVMLNDCQVFHGWEEDILDRLAAGATVRKYKAGTTIMKAGDQVTHLHLIRCGVVRAMKSMDQPQLSSVQYGYGYSRPGSPNTVYSADRALFTSRSVHTATTMATGPASASTGPASPGNSSTSSKSTAFVDERPPGLWVREKNWKGLLETFAHETHNPESAWPATVGVLGTGQFFGEISILDPDRKNNGPKSITTIVAYTDAEIFLIDSATMIAAGARFKASTMNALNDSFSLCNPPDDKIVYYMKHKFDWEKRRGKIIAEVMKDRKNPK